MSKLTARFLMLLVVLIVLYMWWMVSWSFYDENFSKQQAYQPRNCTLFAQDFSAAQDACCDAYSRAYWQGGTYEEKLAADHVFGQCIVTSGDLFSKRTHVWHGLQKFTSIPYLHTPWRWGYGWAFGRGYRQ